MAIKSQPMRISSTNFRTQRGVVLVVSLVFLIALTAVAAALMQNTTADIKMSGASQDKVVANQESIACNDTVVYNEVSKLVDDSNMFALSPSAYPAGTQSFAVGGCNANSSATVVLENSDRLELDCSHNRGGTSTDFIKCNRIRIDVTTTYGRSNNSNITAHSTVEQQIIGNN